MEGGTNDIIKVSRKAHKHMKISQDLKRHIISGIITFSTGFLLATVPILTTLTLEDLNKGALIGLLLAGFRAGLKVLYEQTLAPKSDVQS